MEKLKFFLYCCHLMLYFSVSLIIVVGEDNVSIFWFWVYLGTWEVLPFQFHSALESWPRNILWLWPQNFQLLLFPKSFSVHAISIAFLLNSGDLLMANLLIVIVTSSGINGNLLLVLIYHLYYSTTRAILSQRNFLEGHKSSENRKEAKGITLLKRVEPREPTGLGTRRVTATQDCGLVIHCSRLCDEIHFSRPLETCSRLQFLIQSPTGWA